METISYFRYTTVVADVFTTEIDKPSSLLDEAPIHCQFPSRLALTGIILDCIRQLFSSSRNLMHPQLKDFFWADKSTQDVLRAPYQVTIEDSFFFDLSKNGIRPAVIVKAGTWQESKLTIGDNGLAGSTYCKKITGSHSVTIIAKTVSQAELLAREVHGYLSHFGPLLREWMQLSRWEVPAIGEPTEAEEQSENVVISINVSYEIMYSWDLHPDTSRLLRQIVINAIMTNTDINFPLGA